MPTQETPRDRVRFDLSRGRVQSAGDRVVMVPTAAFDDLGKKVGLEAACDFGRAMGSSLGAGLGKRLGGSDGVRSASIERVVTELGTELAVSGWGSLHMERWGRAMLLVVEDTPLAEYRFIAAILEGALSTASGQKVHCVPLTAEGVARILVAGSAVVERARGWVAEGVAWRDVLTRVQSSGEGGRS